MFKKKSKDFSVWAEGGKYFLQLVNSEKVSEISKDKFKEILANETIRSIGFTQNQSLGLHELINHYNKHCDAATSEFGRRVRVDIVEAEQKKSDSGGVDAHFKLDIVDEKTGETADDLFAITAQLEGITGSLTDKGVSYPEAFRSLYQLAFNGVLATSEDHEKGKLALQL